MPQRKYDLHGISNPGRKDNPVNDRILGFDQSPSGKVLIVVHLILAVAMFGLFGLGLLVNKTPQLWYVVFYVLLPTYFAVGILRLSFGSRAWLLPKASRDSDEKSRSPEDESYAQDELSVNLVNDRYGKMAEEGKKRREAIKGGDVVEPKAVVFKNGARLKDETSKPETAVVETPESEGDGSRK